MRKNDFVFTALLAAVFCMLAATIGLMRPIDITVSGTIDADLPAVNNTQTVVTTPPTTLPAVTTPAVTQPADNGEEATTVPAETNTNDSSIPQGNEAILAKYSELMNDAKLITLVEKLYNYCKSAESYRAYVMNK